MSMTVGSSQQVNTAATDSSSSKASLEKQKAKIEAEIKKLQQEDAKKNEEAIKSLEQQLQQIEVEISKQSETSGTQASGGEKPSAPPQGASEGKGPGPAYSVELSGSSKSSSQGGTAVNAGPAYAVELGQA